LNITKKTTMKKSFFQTVKLENEQRKVQEKKKAKQAWL